MYHASSIFGNQCMERASGAWLDEPCGGLVFKRVGAMTGAHVLKEDVVADGVDEGAEALAWRIPSGLRRRTKARAKVS